MVEQWNNDFLLIHEMICEVNKAWNAKTLTEDLRSFGYGRILFPFT
jgi:hypothetical protein